VPDERTLVFKLYGVLKAADMTVTTEKMVRANLAAELGGGDLSEHKALIKTHVSRVVAMGGQRGAGAFLEGWRRIVEGWGREGRARAAAAVMM